MSINELAAVLKSDIIIRQFHGQHDRWIASIEHAETKDKESSSILSGTYGDSDTPTKALENYCVNISHKYIVVHVGREGERRGFQLRNVTPN